MCSFIFIFNVLLLLNLSNYFLAVISLILKMRGKQKVILFEALKSLLLTIGIYLNKISNNNILVLIVKMGTIILIKL